jgi:hypothetical protein
MTNFYYYENRQNKIISLKRKQSIPFSHIWKIYNLESLRYFKKTNIKLTDYSFLYKRVYTFLNFLEKKKYRVKSWIIKLKKNKFLKKKGFRFKKLRSFKHLASKMFKTNTTVSFKAVVFQKQISSTDFLINLSQKDNNFNRYNTTINFCLESQLNNEKIRIR